MASNIDDDKIKVYKFIFNIICRAIILLIVLSLLVFVTIYLVLYAKSSDEKWKYLIIDGFFVGTLYLVIRYFFSNTAD